MHLHRTFGKALLVGIFAFSSIFFISPYSASAQTASGPQVLITWKADSYVPPFYQGKALPSLGSKITASLEVVSNGKIVNVQSQPIYWYLDETLIGGGAGAQTVTFPPFGTPPGILYLTVSLPQYSGGLLQGKADIPYVNPVAVIVAPYPKNEFSTNPVAVDGYPFYFNASSPSGLSYSWAVNGQAGGNAEDPQVASISLPQGTPSGTGIDISLSITNSGDSTVATAEKVLAYQSQL